MTPQEFVRKWRSAAHNERQGSQSHFIDLCQLLNVPTPTDADPTGTHYTFEKGVAKAGKGTDFADVWKRNTFAWEYKKKHANLNKAYEQLLRYREALENPPLLVVSDMERIEVHTNFTSSIKQIVVFTLDDLLDPRRLDQVRRIWTDPDTFRAPQTTAQATEEAAKKFAELADILRKWGHAPHPAAHYLIRLLFCLFAEDVGLLPDKAFSKLIRATRGKPDAFAAQLRQLFGAMRSGGYFGYDEIPHFNGGLFDDDLVLRLPVEGIEKLQEVSELNWSSIEPAIFGTLFERSLDPTKRAQLGAHYTSREDILLIVEPVLMAPLRREWERVRAEAEQAVAGGKSDKARQLLRAFADKIAQVRVLDPAAGSGNFLYVALKQLLDLEKEVITAAQTLTAQGFFPQVSPEQLHGMELNEYAHELAQTTVWIGYIQWMRDNGYGRPTEPILKDVEMIRQMDAILTFDEAGNPVEPEWVVADVVIGNPPFLGGKRLRAELGDKYVDSLFNLYERRVPHEADLVTYWFERTRAYIEAGNVQRAGLLATNSIRGGANRDVLKRIKETGDIFMGWSDREWVLDGAAVRISMVGFDNGTESSKVLDGHHATVIHSDLTKRVFDLTTAVKLRENANLAFMGDTKGGAFDLTNDQAQKMLNTLRNPNGRPNSDVIVPWVNGLDITRRPRGMWIVDFGVTMSLEDASLYEQPFEWVKQHVYPLRKDNNRRAYADKWWLHAEPRQGMRTEIAKLNRFIATPHLSKHRIFVWLDSSILPDHQLCAITRSDDYFLGVLQSHIHELWAILMGTSLGPTPRYTTTTTFETFPFPFPPGQEPPDDPRVQAIAAAARSLVDKRDRWLNPDGANAAELKQRTLTNLYNQRPQWLVNAHAALDEAVFAAYGWDASMGDDAVLAALLELNGVRSKGKTE